jgi:sodium transport system permease protein
MNLRHIRLIWAKEILDTIRDRRAVITMVVVPLLLMPLLVLGPNVLRLSQEEGRLTQTQDIAVINAEAAPLLVTAIENDQGLAILQISNPVEAIQDEDISALVIIPDDFEEAITNETGIDDISIQYKISSSSSEAALEKLSDILDAYEHEIVAARLEQRGISEDLISPFRVQRVNVAPVSEVSGYFLSLLLPLFLILWAAVGGAQTAIDLSVGEKERGTLEFLLVSPPKRASFVLGKVLTVFSVTLVATTLSLSGFALSLTYGGVIFPGSQLFDTLSFALSIETLLLLFATVMVAAIMMSALTFALYLWTRSFKQAQTFTTYLSFAVMIPAFAVSFTDPPTNTQAFIIPVYNATAILKSVLLGNIDWTNILVTYGSCAFYAAIGLIAAIRMYNNERVLFRQ